MTVIDLYLAAAIQAATGTAPDIDIRCRTVLFNFPMEKEIENTAAMYTRGELLVNAPEYALALKVLRGEMHRRRGS